MKSGIKRLDLPVKLLSILAMMSFEMDLGARPNEDAPWQHRTRLNAPQRMLPLGIGAAVAASETGVIAVGGGQDPDIGVDAGAVAIWNCTVNEVVMQESITHPKEHRQSAFGNALAIDPAARVLCIGAPNEDGTDKDLGKWPENFQMGRVYLYMPQSAGHAGGQASSGAHWKLCATLESPQPNVGAHFGSVVATDGARVVVGSPNHNSVGFAAGRVDVFVRRGDLWMHESELAIPLPIAGMRFGTSLAIDAETIVVGSPSFSGFGAGSGRVDVFRLKKDGWQHTGRIDAPNPQSSAWFGMSVAISRDILAVGAPRETPLKSQAFPDHAGVVHLFKRTETQSEGEAWQAIFALTSPDPWCGKSQYRAEAFGMSLSIRRGTLAVGASESCNPVAAGEDHDEGEGSGAVYLFHPADVGGTSWDFGARVGARLTAPDAAFDAHDGYRVALGCAQAGMTQAGAGSEIRRAIPFLVVGRAGNPDMSPGPGAAHVYWPHANLPQNILSPLAKR
ncbi:hypothetical protein LBMAG51_05810 [Phycisphaerae bacterium]|nr:hypothetical protein LBMAG51_05810 [Phycisphaerae bacterium]